MLQKHQLIPHFAVTDLAGARVDYTSVWQRRNLVLVTLPRAEAPSRTYADRLVNRVHAPDDDNTTWVITEDRVAGVSCPSVVIADQWGEIVHLVHPSRVEDLPAPDELMEWVRYLGYRCPECEGEAR